MSESDKSPEVAALESALRALQPAPPAVNRDAILYRAGQASVIRRHWLWPAATAAMTLLAVGLAAVVVLRSPAMGPERIVYVHVPQPAEAGHALAHASQEFDNSRQVETSAAATGAVPSPISYVLLRQQGARHGVDAIPEAPSVMPIAVPAGENPQSWWRMGDEPSTRRF